MDSKTKDVVILVASKDANKEAVDEYKRIMSELTQEEKESTENAYKMIKMLRLNKEREQLTQEYNIMMKEYNSINTIRCYKSMNELFATNLKRILKDKDEVEQQIMEIGNKLKY